MSSDGRCFLCGKVGLPPASTTQGHRHYFRQVTVFQSYLSPAKNEVNECVETCAACLSEVETVWDLHQQIEAIRGDVAQVLGRVRAAMSIKEGERVIAHYFVNCG